MVVSLNDAGCGGCVDTLCIALLFKLQLARGLPIKGQLIVEMHKAPLDWDSQRIDPPTLLS